MERETGHMTSTVLQDLQKRSKMRRELLAQQFGLTSTKILPKLIHSREYLKQRKAERIKFRDGLNRLTGKKRSAGIDMDPQKPLMAGGNREGQGEDLEEVYTDSSAFLKGTQSANPHNDYCQNFVDKGERPQNFIRDVGLTNRFEEYPKLREFILLKDEHIQKTNTPPMYLSCDLETFDLRDLDAKFDVILLEPPLEEYQRSLGMNYDKFWNWDEIEKLEIESISAQRSFIWIWCGSSDGLDAGRRCLKKWGYRRCEDICWIKTNIKNPTHNKNLESNAIFQRTKEHCLMGIKGTVRRSIDGDFIHANVDIDLIIADEQEWGCDDKPVEIFHIIEHFCLGRRRLHLFGRDSNIRPGWLTVGPRVTGSNYDSATYNGFFTKEPDGFLTGCTEEIERMRPKSPPPKVKMGDSGAGGNMGGVRMSGARGGGAGGMNIQVRGGAMMAPPAQRMAPPPPRTGMLPPMAPQPQQGMLGGFMRGGFNRGGGVTRGGWGGQRPMLPPR